MFSTLFKCPSATPQAPEDAAEGDSHSRVPATFYKDLAGLGGIFSAAYLWLLIA